MVEMMDPTSDSLLHHRHPHPQFHPRGRQWAGDKVIHVAVAYSNTSRWRARRELFEKFRQEMQRTPNVVLHVGELAMKDQPFEVTEPGHHLDYQFRSHSILWHKERLLNRVIEQFPKDWEYGAYVDADVLFTRYDWAIEAIQKLQIYDWLQLFSTYSNLGPNQQVLNTTPSCVKRYLDNAAAPRNYVVSATGLAWAFRRDAFDKCGGLMDRCILGSADWHMALGLLGVVDTSPEVQAIKGTGYAEYIRAWQVRASREIRQNVSYVENHAIHYWHGPKAKRKYGERWKILQQYEYNPWVDVYTDWQGMLQLTPEKPRFRDAIRLYFQERCEDSIELDVPQ